MLTRIGEGLVTAFSRLSYLMIETNSSCNLACLSCNRSLLAKKGWRSFKNLSSDEWLKTLSLFKDCPLEIIKVEGLSEPMLHPQFDSLMKLLRELFPKAFVIIATNLQYSFEQSPFLKTLPYVDMVYLSIDGIEDTYELLRPPAKWSVAKDWLESSLKKIDLCDRKNKLHLNFTATKNNVDQLPRIYELKENYQLSSVRINLAQNWNGHEINQNTFDDDFIKKLLPYKKDVKGVAGWSFKDCFWPYEGMVVDVFGNVRQCVINTSQTPLGNIWQDDVAEVFNKNINYLDTRKKLSSDSPGIGCENCDYKFLAKDLESLLGGKFIQNFPRKFKR